MEGDERERFIRTERKVGVFLAWWVPACLVVMVVAVITGYTSVAVALVPITAFGAVVGAKVVDALTP